MASPAPSLVAPHRIKYVKPTRPKGPRPAGEGVVLELLIDKTGKVESVELLQSLAPAWDAAALAAARQWEYTPTIWKGEPAVMYLTVTVKFEP
jgi:TonB family protein